MSKELIEQLAKEHGMVFDQSYRSVIPKGRVEYVFTSIEHLEAFAKAYAQTQGQSIPDGFRLVPIEPTQKMLSNAADFGDFSAETYLYIYKAMLNAAPIESGVKG